MERLLLNRGKMLLYTDKLLNIDRLIYLYNEIYSLELVRDSYLHCSGKSFKDRTNFFLSTGLNYEYVVYDDLVKYIRELKVERLDLETNLNLLNVNYTEKFLMFYRKLHSDYIKIVEKLYIEIQKDNKSDLYNNLNLQLELTLNYLEKFLDGKYLDILKLLETDDSLTNFIID